MRQVGILMPVSALPGNYSCGGFGSESRFFVDFLVKMKCKVWQVLPFCLPDECHSPYKSYSSFSANPCFISPEILHEVGLITEGELRACAQYVPYTCEFKRLEEERLPLLKRAAGRFRDRGKVSEYLRAHPQIEAFCRFMALKEQNGGSAWQTWKITEPDPELVYTEGWIQYEFDREWRAVKAYANERGIRIIGDIPIYVADDSADVWANPELFELDESGYPTAVAGCPPDYFSEDGQLWGNPLYRWDTLKEKGFSFWRERLTHAFDWFDGVRLDHFRGFASYWKIPAGAKTAREGTWAKGPRRAFVDMVRSIADGRTVIAEDLGDITPDVPKLLSYSGFPGMRVFQFGFAGDPTSAHMPCHYPQNCVAYTGTHDNDTMLGYVWSVAPDERARMMAYLGCENATWEETCAEAVRSLYACSADTVIFPLQDLLVFGTDTRFNRPGLAEGNWAFRFTAEQIGAVDTGKFARWADLYDRAGEEKIPAGDCR